MLKFKESPLAASPKTPIKSTARLKIQPGKCNRRKIALKFLPTECKTVLSRSARRINVMKAKGVAL